MKVALLRAELDKLASVAGIDGCALVEIDAGMVWHTAGQIPGVQSIAEAASDYWRLYQRLAHHFDDLGDLLGSLMRHTGGQLALLPCGKGMLLVVLAMQKSTVDWSSCFAEAKKLARQIDQM